MKLPLAIKIGCLLVAMQGLMAPTQAEVLVQWDPQGFSYTGEQKTGAPKVWQETAVSSDGLEVGVVIKAQGVDLVEGLTLGSGFRLAIFNNSWGGHADDTGNRNKEESLLAGKYLTFSIMAEPGYALFLKQLDSSLILDDNVEYGHCWQYALDGGGFKDVPAETPVLIGNYRATQGRGAPLPPADLEGIRELQGTKAKVTFRLVLWKISSEEQKRFMLVLGRYEGANLAVSGEAKRVK